MDYLMVSAGYIPETDLETYMTGQEHQIVVGAVRELLGRSKIGGFIPLMQNLIQERKK